MRRSRQRGKPLGVHAVRGDEDGRLDADSMLSPGLQEGAPIDIRHRHDGVVPADSAASRSRAHAPRVQAGGFRASSTRSARCRRDMT